MSTYPPNPTNDESFHWLRCERASTPSVAQWIDGRWYCIDEKGGVTPNEMFRRGWVYWKPIENPGDPVESFNEPELEQVWHDNL